jgi:hypothetical protein
MASNDDKPRDYQRRDYKKVGIEPPQELFDLAAGVRGMIEKMVRIDAGGEAEAVLRDVHEEVDRLTERLARVARRGDNPRLLEDI